MAGPSRVKVYKFLSYKVFDQGRDKILTRDEVKIRSGGDKYRTLTAQEWTKFVATPAVQNRYKFITIDREMSAHNITRALEIDPSILTSIIRQMNGTGNVVLVLEDHFKKYGSAEHSRSRLKLGQWESEFQSYHETAVKASNGVKVRALAHYLFHSDAIKTFESFVPAAKKTKDTRSNALAAMDAILANSKQLMALIHISSLSTFIFAKKNIKYVLEATLTDGLIRGEADCDKYAALYVHLGEKMGWKVKLYKFNNHVAVIFENSSLPGGRVVVEPTTGLIVDTDFYMRDPRIGCLKLGFPISTFEQEPETIVASVYLQEANDLLEKRKYKEAIRYMKLVEQLQPNDPSLYVTMMSFLMEAGKPEELERYRKKLIKLISEK
jgi:tetratricopeptide (TPR) repeat protein